MQATLTERENEVAELLAWGAAKKQVASKLFISEDTVANHARHIYVKTGVRSIGQLCAWWFCTKFKIPMSLNPIPVIAFFFFALWGGSEVTGWKNQAVCVRTIRKKSDEDTTTDCII